MKPKGNCGQDGGRAYGNLCMSAIAKVISFIIIFDEIIVTAILLPKEWSYACSVVCKREGKIQNALTPRGRYPTMR